MDLTENGVATVADPSNRTVGPTTGMIVLPFRFTVATPAGQRWTVEVSALVGGVKRATCGGTQQYSVNAGVADASNAVLSGPGLTQAVAGQSSTVDLMVTDQYGNGAAVSASDISASLVPLRSALYSLVTTIHISWCIMPFRCNEGLVWQPI